MDPTNERVEQIRAQIKAETILGQINRLLNDKRLAGSRGERTQLWDELANLAIVAVDDLRSLTATPKKRGRPAEAPQPELIPDSNSTAA